MRVLVLVDIRIACLSVLVFGLEVRVRRCDSVIEEWSFFFFCAAVDVTLRTALSV